LFLLDLLILVHQLDLWIRLLLDQLFLGLSGQYHPLVQLIHYQLDLLNLPDQSQCLLGLLDRLGCQEYQLGLWHQLDLLCLHLISSKQQSQQYRQY
jgi:hypothetical protein